MGVAVRIESWLVFVAIVSVLFVVDMAFHRSTERRRIRDAAIWSAFFVAAGLLFSLFVWVTRGQNASLEYLTAYLIEESLSVDNLFVFLALFTYFGVKAEHQHRVLLWGIIGAVVMRGVFIFAGVALLERFHWLIYILGVFLIATGAKLGLGDEEEVHPERNVIVRWASRVLPIEKAYDGDSFTILRAGKRRFTPLVLVLLAIESTDLMFAVDSVPAVLAVSRDPFVVYTSNIFAVIGLRALYSLLSGALGALRFLRPALALILMLIGAKMLLAEVFDVPTPVALGVVALVLAVATAASLLLPPPPEPEP